MRNDWSTTSVLNANIQRFRDIESVHRGDDLFVSQRSRSLREKVKGLASNMVDSTKTATVNIKDKVVDTGSKVVDSTIQGVKKVKSKMLK